MKKGNNNVMCRLVSVILVVFMIFSMLPSAAFAGEVTEITQPTQAATQATTEAATEATTEATTEAATEAPTEATTEAATEATTEATTEEPTSDLVEAPTDAPVEEPTSDLVEAPTDAEQEESTEEEPTEAPVEEPTEETIPEDSNRVSVYFKNAAGTVALDGKPTTYVDVEPGVVVPVNVEAPVGYYIKSVTIVTYDADNAVIGEPAVQNFDKETEKYETTIAATEKRTVIQVEFEKKQYKVTVTVDGNGKVRYNNDDATTQAIYVEFKDTPKFRLDAEKDYIVSDVYVNGVSKNINTSPCFSETSDGLFFTAEEITADTSIIVKFEKAEKAIVDDVSIVNDYFTITYAPDTEPVTVLTDLFGHQTIVLPKDGSATFRPAGEYADGYISLNGSALDGSIVVTEDIDLDTITVNKSNNGNKCRYKEVAVNFEIVFDGEVKAADIFLPDETVATTDDYYAHESLNAKIVVADDIAGIKEVDYYLYNGEKNGADDVYVQHATLLDSENAADNILKINGKSYEGTIRIDASKINQKKARLVVIVTDKAGNTTQTERKLFVNTYAPDVSIVIDGSSGENPQLEGHYTAAPEATSFRTATITIKDWSETFNKESATDAISIITAPEAAEGAEAAYKISEWVSKGNVHTCTIEFISEGYYEWSFGEYVNKAGLSDSDVDASATDGKDDYIFAFTCDRTAPSGELSIGTLAELAWYKTIGKFSNKKLTVTVKNVTDNITPVENIKIEYATYEITSFDVVPPSTVKAIEELSFEDNCEVTADYDAIYIIYARLTDGAGNVKYIASNGLVIDTTAGSMTAKIVNEKENGYYNGNVTIEIESVVDQPAYRDSKKAITEQLAIYSGIASVDYKIEVLGDDETVLSTPKPVSGCLYNFGRVASAENPIPYDELVTELYKDSTDFTHTIVVDAETFNYDNVRVTITATDNAGNTIATKEFKFNINATSPEIDIKVSEESVNIIDGRGYFKVERTATVTITDRATTFNPTAEDITITAVTPFGKQTNASDSLLNDVGNLKYTIGTWTTTGDTHTATIAFNGDVNYDWEISYTNKAGSAVTASVETDVTDENAHVSIGGTTPFTFTVDKTAPDGTVSIDESSWSKFVETITFGLYTNKSFIVKIATWDLTSPIADIDYFTSKTAYSESDLKKNEALWVNDLYTYTAGKDPVYEFTSDKITINAPEDPDEQFIVYVRMTDMAGNVSYLSSDGAVVDRTAPEITLTAPAPVNNGIHTENLTITVNVNDVFATLDGQAIDFSGIKEVSYWIGYTNAAGKVVLTEQQTKLYPIEGKDTVDATERKQNLEKTFTVEATDDNNVCNLQVCVIAEDNAGNVSYTSTVDYVNDAGETESSVTELDFDITTPVVNVEYKDTRETIPYDSKYFDAARPAVITVTERTEHFKHENVTVHLNPTTDVEGIIITAKKADKETNANASLVYDAATNSVAVVDVENADTAKTVLEITESAAWLTQESDATGYPAYVNGTKHSLNVVFEADANYTVSVNYKDKANHRTTELLGETEFTVDKTAPTGSIIVTTVSTKTTTKFESREETGDTVEGETVTSEPITFVKLATDLTYSIYANKSISFDQTSDDEISPIAEVFCYTQVRNDTDALEALTVDALEEVEWTALEKDGTKVGTIKTIEPDTQAVVYLKIIDMAGNVTYISTTGLIADSKAPVTETKAPELNIEIVDNDNPLNGIYNGDVVVKVTAQEPVEGKTYSGLKTIYYKVYKDDSVTQTGTLFDFTTENPSWDDLEQDYVYADPSTDEVQNVINEWESGGGNGFIVVKSSINDSNGVRVEVYAEDNALNTGKAELALKIDITPPEVSVSYSPETGDSENTSYFNSNRTATITVKERNFDTKNFTVSINNADGSSPSMSEWSEPTGSGDDTTYTATIEYTADGDYTFSVDTCVDDAGNEAKTDLSTLNASFTIDQTVPTVSVSYDNNTAQNDKYFNATRTATITVTEHNFQESRAEATITASLSGSSVTTPSVSWSSSGDTHTGTVNYSSDADYTFDIQITDMAGNQDSGADYGSSVAAQDFTVDTTIDEIVITGVENGISYKDEAIPSISFSDVNFQDYDVTLHRTRVAEKDKDVEAEYLIGMSEDGSGFSGTFDTFDVTKTENDGLYTLYAEASDLAGNTTSKTVQFTLNRFGSVYVFNNDLIDLLKKEYRRDLNNEETGAEYNLVITEYNPDKLVEGSLELVITHDGAPLDNVIFTVDPVINDLAPVGESGWYQYDYNISLDNFRILSKACPNCGREYAEQEDADNDAEQVTYVNCTECAVELDADSQVIDGIYKITVASQDAAGNRPETTSDDAYEMLFRLDSTKPEITSVIGLEKKIVNADTQKIDFEIFDAIGLRSVTMMVDGKAVVNPTEEEIARQISYSGSYTVSTGLNQKISFIIEDMAGNITDTDEKNEDDEYVFNPDYLFERDLSVSTKWYERWYADRTVFWGSIAGAVCLAAAFIILISHFHKKKKATKAK